MEFFDRIGLLLIKHKIFDDISYIKSYTKAQQSLQLQDKGNNIKESKKSKNRTDANILRNKREWIQGTNPQGSARELLKQMVLDADSNLDRKILEDVLDNPAISVMDFISQFDINYDEVKEAIDSLPRIKQEWESFRQYFPSLYALTVHIDSRAHKVFSQLEGSELRLYRRHSLLRGYVQESIQIEKGKGFSLHGNYYQVTSNKGDLTPIPVNIFYADWYLFILAALTSKPGENDKRYRPVEMVTINVLIDQIFDKNGDQREDSRYMMGILTGMYDDEDTLLAERVLIERMPAWRHDEPRTRHVRSEEEDPSYLKIMDAIDNTLDGQTLTVRNSRLEWTVKKGQR